MKINSSFKNLIAHGKAGGNKDLKKRQQLNLKGLKLTAGQSNMTSHLFV